MNDIEMVAEATIAVRINRAGFQPYTETIKIVWRGRDQYAVQYGVLFLGADGNWDFEPSDWDANAAFKQTHRFSFDQAVHLATQKATEMKQMLET